MNKKMPIWLLTFLLLTPMVALAAQVPDSLITEQFEQIGGTLQGLVAMGIGLLAGLIMQGLKRVSDLIGGLPNGIKAVIAMVLTALTQFGLAQIGLGDVAGLEGNILDFSEGSVTFLLAFGVNQGTFNLYKLVRGDAAGSADAEAKAGN